MLEDTSVLEGPYSVPRWVLHGQQRVFRFTQPVARCPVVKGIEGIEFITIMEEMEPVLLLERHFADADEAGWSSTEPIYGLSNHEPRVWVFPRLPVLLTLPPSWETERVPPGRLHPDDGWEESGQQPKLWG